jgi:hypothetical protein
MKRFILSTVCALLLIVPQLFINCSQPLESADNPGGVQPGPGLKIDTLVIIDTIVVVNENKTDTLYVFDTTVHIDTLVIIDPGGGSSQIVCDQLGSGQKYIVWMFRNPGGEYLLEFVANAERIHPSHDLSVFVNGVEYTWLPAESSEFLLQEKLEENAVIRIVSNKPSSLGHPIDICLTLGQL